MGYNRNELYDILVRAKNTFYTRTTFTRSGNRKTRVYCATGSGEIVNITRLIAKVCEITINLNNELRHIGGGYSVGCDIAEHLTHVFGEKYKYYSL